MGALLGTLYLELAPGAQTPMMKILKDESGQSIVIVAAFMGLVAMGFLAFALDVGNLSRQKRMAQAAADAAALAAAEEVQAGATSNEQTVANAIAKMNGFDTTLASNPAVVTLTTPQTGNYTGTAYVKATVSQPIATMFLGAFRSSWATMSVSASAIAGSSQTSQTCVCVGGGTGTTLSITGGSRLNATGCGIIDNSTASNAITVSGGSTLSSLSVGTVSSSWTSSANVTGGSTYSVTDTVTGTNSSCSPTLPTAPTYGSCLSDPGGSWGTFTFGPASASSVICYNSLTVGANGSTCTLNPGIYVINGGTLHFESGAGGYSNLGGQGVFFYLIGSASLVIDNGANINLVSGGATESGGGTAPTVGTYNGILIYQVSADTSPITIAGGSSSYMNGAVYAPGATVTMSNGSDTNVKGGIYASSLALEGGSTFTPVADVNEGSLAVGSPKLLQ
jgi:Flp pilus assembly protein TadG